MRTVIRQTLDRIFTQLWLREGTTRRVLWGPYRGLQFCITPSLQNRPGVFYRSYEPDVTAWLRSYIQPGMTVYTLGAHVGIHVLNIARMMRGQGHIFAFEGWPENYDALVTNIGLNHYPGVCVQAIPVCVSDTSGTVKMVHGTSDGKHHIALSDDTAPTVDVAATTLDEFASDKQRCPDLITMDIEGHEMAAIRGSYKLVERCRPMLLIEHHDRRQKLAQWLKPRKYIVENLGKRHIVAKPY